jgi:hypothetical protein
MRISCNLAPPIRIKGMTDANYRYPENNFPQLRLGDRKSILAHKAIYW